MVLETAAKGSADYLVTFNVRHLADTAGMFGIRVLQPRAAWEAISRR